MLRVLRMQIWRPKRIIRLSQTYIQIRIREKKAENSVRVMHRYVQNNLLNLQLIIRTGNSNGRLFQLQNNFNCQRGREIRRFFKCDAKF